MLAKLLEHRPGVDTRREIGVTKEEFLIGRGPDCDLRLAVPAVSRHHCLLRFRGSEATLTDLGSVNGTFVNGQRVRSSMTLQPGDDTAADARVEGLGGTVGGNGSRRSRPGRRF